MASDPVVHLVAIDWSGLPADVSESMAFRQADIAELLALARTGADGPLEMVIIATRQRFQMYSAGAGSSAGIRRVLRGLLDRARGLSRLGAARAVDASGVAAARELFRVATGLDADFALGLRGLYAVTMAAAVAAEAGTIGDHLAPLFGCANGTAWLAHSETEHAAPLLSSERRELARFAVERIVEEQLLVWQSSYAEPARGAVVSAFPTQYPNVELSSILRLQSPSANESVA